MKREGLTMLPEPNREFTDHILHFGMDGDIAWVSFRTRPAEYYVARDNEHFMEIIARFTQAREQDQPVHVRFQDVQILFVTFYR
jgi:hypothetical protein